MASVAGHAAILLVLLSVRAPLPRLDVQPMTVMLIAQPPPDAPVVVEQPVRARPSPPHATLKPQPTPPVRTIHARVTPPTVEPPEVISALTQAQLAGAATADSGSSEGDGSGSGGASGGGRCNMARLLQNALRKDPLVQAAARTSTGKAFVVWNGDWVQGSGEDGKGLAAVREAIMWEVGFAPAACRTEPVHGLVLISLNDTPGAPRLVVGTGGWRWADLLTPRRYTGDLR